MTAATPPASGSAGNARPRATPSAASAAARFGVGATPEPAKPSPAAPGTGRDARRSTVWKRLRGVRLRWPRPRLRLLPLTIFFAVLMLGVRVSDLWHAVTGTGGLSIQAVPPSLAQSAPQPVAQSTPQPALQPPPPSLDGTRIPTPVFGVADAEPAGGGARAGLLQQLSERREELDERARDLDRREALLAAAEKSIDQKVEELTRLRAEIEGLLRKVDDQKAGQLESLVKIYESMKPKDAARIFDELDMPVLLDVLERMKESKSAPILASMDPMKAKEITAHLAERRTLPGTVR